MFRLFRYYSLASAVAIVAVSAVLAVVLRQNAVAELVELAESQNVVLARSFANTIWPRFAHYVATVSEVDGDTLRARPETQQIHEVIVTLATELPILKVKIYNLAGITIYSSQPSQIGEDMSNSPRFLASVRQGKPQSKLSFRDRFSALSGEIENRDLVESYLPIRRDDGTVEGVFELYTDVTPAVAKIDRTTTMVTVGLLLIFTFLYGVLSLIVRRADSILRRQYGQLRRSEDTLKARNVQLEHQVTERRFVEKALREAHDTLEQRVAERTGELEREIAERKRAEEAMRAAKQQAELANRAKSEFLANMSHELRTPLNAIIGFSEIIKTATFGPVGSPKYRDYAKDINDSGQHLLQLITDILDLSKIEAGKLDLYEETFDASKVVSSCLALVKERARNAGVTLETEIAEDLPSLRADERKLKQILLNLLSNAVKFMPAGGTVTTRVWCRRDDGYVFQVADTGIGIAPGDIPKVLAPFGQADGTLARKFEGTGLGLPLTKSLVELHGGSLDLQSEVGVGTTVTVCFPAERIASKVATDPELPLAHTSRAAT